MPLESIGWFFIGAGSVILLECLINLGRYVFFRIKKKRFETYIKNLKAMTEGLNMQTMEFEKEEPGPKNPREVSELSFRDKEGVMNTVRIVIDSAIDQDLLPDNQELQQMIKSGEAGSLTQLMEGHSVSEDAMGKVQEFVFSPSAVRNMRMAGIEPDDVVTRMLKASGRMP